MAVGFVHFFTQKHFYSQCEGNRIFILAEFISPPPTPPTTFFSRLHDSLEVTVLWGNGTCRLEPPHAEQGN